MQQIDLDKLPPFSRKQIDLSMRINQNVSYEEHNTFRNDSEMEESQWMSFTTFLLTLNLKYTIQVSLWFLC